MAKTKLNREEAEEYTKNLGSVAVGNFGLMEFAMHSLNVPEALGMSNEEWVQERLGGYVRWSVEQRREAVRELSGTATGTGNNLRWERSSKQVAEILGISETTVKRDREVMDAALKTREIEPRAASAVLKHRDKLTSEQKAKEIRRLIDLYRSDAEIALEMGIGVSTVSKERTAYRKDQDAATRKPNEKWLEARKKLEEEQAAKSEAQKKADKVASDEAAAAILKAVGGLGAVNIIQALDDATLELHDLIDKQMISGQSLDAIGEALARFQTEFQVAQGMVGIEEAREAS